MPRHELPYELGTRPFRVDEARDLGVSRSRLRASDLSAPFHGVRTPEPALTLRQKCAAYAARMPTDEFFSHLTAAGLWGMPVPTDPELHVSVLAPAHPPQSRGVRGHRLEQPVRFTARYGLRLAEPPAVWLQLAATLDREELIVVGDHLVRRKYPLATIEQLRSAVAEGHGRGIRNARWALDRVRPGTDSPMETRLRRAIVAGGLPEPVVGHTVRDAHGDFVAVPDLAYVTERIAIEYEGDVHRTDRYTFVADISRRELLEDAGWLVIRVVHEHLSTQRQQLLNRIARALEHRHP